jgi:VCBS repeat-containing protein
MNKFYSTLAAIAVLTSGNILAQDAAALTNSLDATSAFDCSYDVKDADNTILLNGSSATQIFTACTDGKLLEVSLDIKGLNDRGTYTVEVRSMKF